MGDAATLALIAPLLLTALALRGGVFAFSWGLLSLACFFWPLFDALYITNLGSLLSLNTDTTLIALEFCRVAACTFTCTAGLAQRMIALGLSHEV